MKYSQSIRIMVMGSILIIASWMFGMVWAGDTIWLQPGVRVWYVGGVQSAGSASYDAETAIVIDRFENGAAYLTQHSASRNWTMPMPVSPVVSPQAASEGAFWIYPDRLTTLQPGAIFTWRGQMHVVSRATYTPTTLPFLYLLPEEALFTLSPSRDIIKLTYAKENLNGDYFFDVQTGLLLSQTEQLGITTTTLTLSEINYDFAARTAFAENGGLHSAFGGYYSATRNMGFGLGTQGYQLTPAVLSRYKNKVLFRHSAILSDTNWPGPVAVDQLVSYDSDLQKAYLSTDNGATWEEIGDHIYMWMPPTDRLAEAPLSASQIRVWNINLNRGLIGVFQAPVWPTAPGFYRLAFDSSGYVSDMYVVLDQLNFWVDSSQDPNKINRMDGLSYYQDTMKPAQPMSGSIVAFELSEYSVNQTAGSITLTVTRNGGTNGDCSVNYATSDGTASAGTEYTAASGTLSWAAGDSAAKAITTSIANKGASSSKTFGVTLSDSLGGVLGWASKATVTIQGNIKIFLPVLLRTF